MARSVWHRPLGVVSDPVSAFHALLGSINPAVWLGSYGERGSGVSVLATGEIWELPRLGGLEALRERWAEMRVEGELSGDIPLGLLGWLAYDLAGETMDIPLGGKGAAVAPSRFLIVTRSLSIDQRSGECSAWALVDSSDSREVDDFLRWSESVAETLRGPADWQEPVPPTGVEARWRDSTDRYRDMIAEAREAIREGEVYQLCTTTSVAVDDVLEDWQLHQLLIESNPTHHQGLLRLGEISLVSASPETFLSVDPSGVVTTRPIKGTRPRDPDPLRDAELARELVSSEKERAENLMIVDLMRNDLQRVCETGSVRVTGLFEIESYASVHQLVSTVSGQLRSDVDAVDVISACFPAGSMTGAPKHRAVSLLAEIESEPRGIYAGAWGWFRPDGSMELAMTIRSAVFRGREISVGVGGGITWSSDPDQEIAEVGHKAKRLLDAVGVSRIHYS